MNTVYIIGNGFDINLGLNTRYSDFANSEYWPFKPNAGRHTSPLAAYLHYHKSIDKWLDLENLLGKYAQIASAKGGVSIEKDKIDYNKLKTSLCEYLKSITTDPFVNKDSTAALLLGHFISKQLYDSLFSFNYTDLSILARKCGLKGHFTCHHIHGELKRNDIVLGFGDNVKNINGYNFMRKSFDNVYLPPDVIKSLLHSDTAVFFGVSMGDIDYAYFDAYFKAVSNPDNSNMVGKRIYIFTYDDKSQEEILENLLLKTNYKLCNLRVLNTFEIITVNDSSKETIANIINGI